MITIAKRMKKVRSPVPPHVAAIAAQQSEALAVRMAAQAERKAQEALQNEVLTPFSPVRRTTKRKGRNRRVMQ